MLKEIIHLENNIRIQIYDFSIIDSRMYIFLTDSEAFIIDPHIDDSILSNLEGKKVKVLITHEHFDHISGINWLKENIACDVIASDICNKGMQNIKRNYSGIFPFLFINQKINYEYVKSHIKLPYVTKADYVFNGYDVICGKGKLTFELYEMNGHSPGSIFILVNKKYLLSGDNLLGNGMELKNVDSDKKSYEKVISFVEKLGDSVVVLPGHGEPSNILEMKLYLTKEGLAEW